MIRAYARENRGAAMNLALPAAQYGDCVFTVDSDGTLTVDHADPRILIADELLNMIRNLARMGLGHPGVTLDGDVLTIDATNRKVIYRIGEYLMQPDCYAAEWPD